MAERKAIFRKMQIRGKLSPRFRGVTLRQLGWWSLALTSNHRIPDRLQSTNLLEQPPWMNVSFTDTLTPQGLQSRWHICFGQTRHRRHAGGLVGFNVSYGCCQRVVSLDNRVSGFQMIAIKLHCQIQLTIGEYDTLQQPLKIGIFRGVDQRRHLVKLRRSL